jgi:hypothetical protein
VRALLVLLAVAALAGAVAATALAGPRDPKRQLTPADNARARAIAVRAADLPGAGWRGMKTPTTDDSPLTCAGFQPDLSDLVQTGRADGLDLQRADGLFVTSTVSVFRTRAMATASFRRVSAPGLIGCLRQVFSEALGSQPGLTVKRLVRRPSPLPKVAPLTRAYRLEVTIAAAGQTIRSVMDVVLLGRDRANAALLVVGVGKAFPSAALVSLGRAVAARMATA